MPAVYRSEVPRTLATYLMFATTTRASPRASRSASEENFAATPHDDPGMRPLPRARLSNVTTVRYRLASGAGLAILVCSSACAQIAGLEDRELYSGGGGSGGGNGGVCHFVHPETSHCYFVEESLMIHSAARNFCKAWGGDLASLADAQELSFVTTNNPDSFNVWVSATDGAEEGTWVWADGSILETTSDLWGPEQPNGGTAANCANINVGTQGLHDELCVDESFVVCERAP